MTIEQAIQTKMKAAVASRTARVFQGAMPAGTALPAVSWDWLPGGESFQAMDGSPVGLGGGVIQVDCIAETISEAEAIRELVRLSFQTHSGIMGGAGGVRVACSVSGKSGGYLPERDDYSASIDISLEYAESQS